MNAELNPRLDVLPPAQRALWDKLHALPAAAFTLYGGTADARLLDDRVTLPWALAAGAALYGARFNPQVTLKALCFFEEGDLASLSPALGKRLALAVRAVDPAVLPMVDPLA